MGDCIMGCDKVVIGGLCGLRGCWNLVWMVKSGWLWGGCIFGIGILVEWGRMGCIWEEGMC